MKIKVKNEETMLDPEIAIFMKTHEEILSIISLINQLLKLLGQLNTLIQNTPNALKLKYDGIKDKVTLILTYIQKCPSVMHSLDLSQFNRLKHCLKDLINDYGTGTQIGNINQIYVLFDEKNPELKIEIDKMKQCGYKISFLVHQKNIVKENLNVRKALLTMVGITSTEFLRPFLNAEKIKIMIYGEIKEMLRHTLLCTPKPFKPNVVNNGPPKK